MSQHLRDASVRTSSLQIVPWLRGSFRRYLASEPDDRANMALSLARAADLSANYIVLVVASCVIATLGLFENNAAAIIAAMIIAPLMPIIQAIAYGALEGFEATLKRGAVSLLAGISIAVTLSALLAKAMGLSEYASEIVARTRPNVLDLAIAIIGGAVASLASLRPGIVSAVLGSSVAVALMPPLCVVGIGIAGVNWDIVKGSSLLFLTNLLGIALSSMVVFLLADFARHRASFALVWTVALTALILVALALSERISIREANQQDVSRGALARTAQFSRSTPLAARFD